MRPINGRNNLTFHLSMFKCDGFYMLDTIRPYYIGICVFQCAAKKASLRVVGGGDNLKQGENETNDFETLIVQ